MYVCISIRLYAIRDRGFVEGWRAAERGRGAEGETRGGPPRFRNACELSPRVRVRGSSLSATSPPPALFYFVCLGQYVTKFNFILSNLLFMTLHCFFTH